MLTVVILTWSRVSFEDDEEDETLLGESSRGSANLYPNRASGAFDKR